MTAAVNKKNVHEENILSKSELGKLTSINLLFFSTEDINTLEEIYQILESSKRGWTVRSFFIDIRNDQERLTKFCNRYWYNIENIILLIRSSLEYPDPQISQVQENVKTIAEEIIRQRLEEEQREELRKIWLTNRSIKIIEDLYNGISIAELLDCCKKFPLQKILLANKTLSQRKDENLRGERIKYELEKKYHDFFREIYKKSSKWKMVYACVKEENSNK